MAGRRPLNVQLSWIEMAKRCLIDGGITGITIERLASRLKVSRGGFYHHFKDRDELLVGLLRHWEASCQCLPDIPLPMTLDEAAAWLERVAAGMVDANGYDGQFDLAVREWARSDAHVERAIMRADQARLVQLQQFFEVLGYSADEADVRAQVFYSQQIGYHTIGARQAASERRRTANIYLDILCGTRRPRIAA